METINNSNSINILKREYRCMCQCGHEKIGFNSDTCPLCYLKEQINSKEQSK